MRSSSAVTTWRTLSWLLGLQVLIFAAYVLYRLPSKAARPRLRRQVQGSLWLIGFYVLVLGMSWLGSFGGIGAIPQPWDSLAMALLALLVYHWGARTGLRSDELELEEIHVPGDFADLHSFTLKRLDHNVMAMTDCKVVLVPHERLKAMTEQQPHLTRLFWFSTNLDACSHREWELSLGRRTAIERTAHLFCELGNRCLRLRFGLVEA